MATKTVSATGGNWSDNGVTGPWTAGGLPAAGDDVVCNATSGALTVDTNAAVCRSINFTGYTNTFAGSSNLAIGTTTVNGTTALLAVAGMTWTNTSTISFVSTSATAIDITTAGKTLGPLVFNGAAGSWRFADNLTTSSTITHSAGILNMNGKTVSCTAYLTATATAKTLTLGAANITCTLSGLAWDAGTGTNLTLNANTSTITCNGTGIAFLGGTKTYNNVTFTGSGGVQISNVNVFANLTRTGTAGVLDSLAFVVDQTVSGILNVTSNSQSNRIRFVTSALGTTRTITVNGSVSLSNVDFQDITTAGTAGTWTGTNLGNAGGNTGITFAGAVTRYWVGNGGNWNDSANHWSATSGGSPGSTMPIPQDTANFNANSFSSGSQTVVANTFFGAKDINWTGVTNSPTWDSTGGGFIIMGSLTMGTVAITGAVPFVFRNRSGTATLTSAGVNFTNGITFQPVAATVSLSDNLTVGAFVHSFGTFTANNFNVTATTVNISTSNIRTLTMGSGTWTLTGTGMIWNATTVTNLTLNPDTSTILISDTSATNKTFIGGTKTYNNVEVTATGTGIVIFNEGNTFNVIKLRGPKNVRFTNGTTTTVSALDWRGTSGNLVTIDSALAGTAATISKAGGTVQADFLSLKDSAATGGATFKAGANSTNVSGNSGWSFTALTGAAQAATMKGAAARALRVGKPLSATMKGLASRALRVGKPLVATMRGVAAHPTLKVGKNVSATMRGIAARQLRVGKSISATMKGTASLARRVAAFRTLAATMKGTAGFARALIAARTLAATMKGVAKGRVDMAFEVLSRITGGGTTIIKRITNIFDD